MRTGSRDGRLGLVHPGHRNTIRLDKRGRRIGRNWWREMNVETLHCAEAAWQALRESDQTAHGVAGTAHAHVAMYQLSDREFVELHPRPTLKALLVGNAGMHQSRAA